MKHIKYFVIYLVVIIGIFYIGEFFVDSEMPPDKYVNEYVDTRIEETAVLQVPVNETNAADISVSGEENVTDSVLLNEKCPVNTELIEAELVYVVDGDTIKVNVNGTELKVRFIGINTPESVHADESKNNDYGIMASDYTKQLLSGIDMVYLQYDEGHQDQYGRELCYVWISNNVDFDNYEDVSNYMVNAIIISEGYASIMFYEPNTRYKEYFELCFNGARENGYGLWKYEDYISMVE